jgi:lysophospholipase L1-like esterase
MNARAKQAAEKGDAKVLFIGDSITQGWGGSRQGGMEQALCPDERHQPRHQRRPHPARPLAPRSRQYRWHGQARCRLRPQARRHHDRHQQQQRLRQHCRGNRRGASPRVVKSLRAKLPETKILILAIFPRNEKPEAQREKNAKASAIASKNADGNMVHYMDIGPTFLTADGTLSKDIMPDLLHLSPKGYELWAQAIEAKVKELSN